MLLLTKLKGRRSNFHYSGPQKAQLVNSEFKIQVTRRVQNIQTRVRTPCISLKNIFLINAPSEGMLRHPIVHTFSPVAALL